MAHLIDKDALIGQIERRIESCAKQREDMLNVQCHALADDASARMCELNCIKDLLDTLEVKEMQEELVSEDLEEASKEWLAPQLDKSYVNYGEVKMMELTHFDGYAMLDAIEFGAKWGKNQAMAEIQAQSMALAHGCPEESESEDLEEAAEKCIESLIPETELNSTTPFALEYVIELLHKAFKACAEWKEQQMMSKAIDVTVHIDAGNYPYIPQMELYDYDKDIPLAKKGDKYKVVLIKED